MSYRIIIRDAKKEDWLKIKKLIGLFPSKIMQSPLPKMSDFVVAVQKEKIIGCAALEVYSKRLAEIRSLVVNPEFQRKGIGSRLVRECLKRAKNKKIYEVLSITGAYNFFRHLGFGSFHREKFALLKVTGKSR